MSALKGKTLLHREAFFPLRVDLFLKACAILGSKQNVMKVFTLRKIEEKYGMYLLALVCTLLIPIIGTPVFYGYVAMI